MLQKPELSAGLMGHLTRLMQTFKQSNNGRSNIGIFMSETGDEMIGLECILKPFPAFLNLTEKELSHLHTNLYQVF